MNYADIKTHDVANGPGIRVSLFVSGCTHHCKNCFNQETWDPEYGTPYTKETEDRILELLQPEYISGLTLLGGDPLDFENPSALLPLVRRVKKETKKNIWCFTGDTLTHILISYRLQKKGSREIMELLEYIDVLVDGPFIEALKDPMLNFRGSTNQMVIRLPETLYWWKVSGELQIHPYYENE